MGGICHNSAAAAAGARFVARTHSIVEIVRGCAHTNTHTHTPAVFAGYMHRHALWQPLLRELQQVALCALCTDAAVTAAETKWSQENVGYVGRPVSGFARRYHCNSTGKQQWQWQRHGQHSLPFHTAQGRCLSLAWRAGTRPTTPRVQAAQHMYLRCLANSLPLNMLLCSPNAPVPHKHLDCPALHSAGFCQLHTCPNCLA